MSIPILKYVDVLIGLAIVMMIIATVALLVVAYTLWRTRRLPPLAQPAG